MSKNLKLFIIGLVLSVGVSSSAFAMGEEVLAKTGQYTFFINPCPTSGMTYYQKMVPCVIKETVQVPRRVFQNYPVPVPVRQQVPTLITEAPVGCPVGACDEATCYPRPSQSAGRREIWGPRMVTVRVPDVQFTPREITRKVMLPQWFAVTEEPRPPRKIRKVPGGG
jgi:hypothetical protein